MQVQIDPTPGYKISRTASSLGSADGYKFGRTASTLGRATSTRLPTLSKSSGSQSLPLLSISRPHTCGGHRQRHDPNKVWRASSDLAAFPLPPLAKGMSRHRCPIGTNASPKVQVSTISQPAKNLQDVTNAGKDALGTDQPWWQGIFAEVDMNNNENITPSEFSALAARFEAEIGASPNDFKLRFSDVDTVKDGRVSLQEWEDYAKLVEAEFGKPRCLMAAWRFLGRRRAAPAKKVRSILLHEGYNESASLQLLSACSRQDNDNIYDIVRKALDQQADPNCCIAAARNNGYTPLTFLSMTTSIIDGVHAAECVHLLIYYKADVHRESGSCGALGKLLPTRVAAQFQNPAVMDALLEHVDIGDRFQWAAGEHNEQVMLQEMAAVCGSQTLSKISGKSKYNAQATVLLIMFASPIYGGGLTPDGAQKLLKGHFDGIKPNSQGCCAADPNGRGLDGTTALMEMAKKGDIKTVKVLLEGKASPSQQDAEGATPLHLASAGLHSQVVQALLEARAEPSMTDHAGFSALMLVGEEKYIQSLQGDDFKLSDNLAREEILRLLRPRYDADKILDRLSSPTEWEKLIVEAGIHGADLESLQKSLRLHESLFFDFRANTGEGRAPRENLLEKCMEMIMSFLRIDPLKGDQKVLTKYLLQATMGPEYNLTLKHVHVPWQTKSNRSFGGADDSDKIDVKLKKLVIELLDGFEQDCDKFKTEIEKDAEENPGGVCAALRALPADRVEIPEEWQDDSYWEDAAYWRLVQKRQRLRFDPEWAVDVKDAATCCLALLRLGGFDDLSDFSALLQVHHRPMDLLVAEGYIAYSELCNKPFQDLMCSVVRNATAGTGANVTFPEHTVGVKKIKRLSEKIRDARLETRELSKEDEGPRDLDWPGRTQEYLAISHCFYILDTVRLSFICNGETQQDQVACCMELVEAFKACTLEKDNLQLLRQKNGFAEGVVAAGGYADVKLLVYAKVGEHEAFDGTKIPLAIIGEVQLILYGYHTVKSRMHLAYEINRGSFGNLPFVPKPKPEAISPLPDRDSDTSPKDGPISPDDQSPTGVETIKVVDTRSELNSPAPSRKMSTRSEVNSPTPSRKLSTSSQKMSNDKTEKPLLPEAAVSRTGVPQMSEGDDF